MAGDHDQLVEMGFPAERVALALKKSGNRKLQQQ